MSRRSSCESDLSQGGLSPNANRKTRRFSKSISLPSLLRRRASQSPASGRKVHPECSAIDGSKARDTSDENEGLLQQGTPSALSVFDALEMDTTERLPRWKRTLRGFVDSTGTTIVMSICTILILFLEDVRRAFLGLEWDKAVVATSATLLAVFMLDLVATSIARPRFCLGAVFWLEVAANVSLFLEIPIFAETVMGQRQEVFDIDDGASVAAAPATSRAGGRANKAAMAMRLIRFTRLVQMHQRHAMKQDLKRDQEGKRQGKHTFNSLGDKLAGRAMYCVAALVLCLLLVLPFFDADLGMYGMPPIFKIGGLRILHELATKGGVSSREFQAALKVYLKDAPADLAGKKTSEVIYLMAANSTILSQHLLKRRLFEVSATSFSTEECSLSDWDGCKVTEAIFDIKWLSQFKAIMGISQTVFVIAIISVGPVLMSRHLYVLVVRPLRVVVEKVKEIANHPMRPATCGHRTRMSWSAEVRMLENSIMKICSLLIVAFGEAGAALIGDNMKEAGALNPMLAGKKVRGVFGFVDIQQFADVIEVLQEESMEFVNAVAQIVHTEVKLHGGIINKNIGEAFLFAWKFPPEVKWKNVKDMIVTACDGELNAQRLVVERASRRSSNASSLNIRRTALDDSLTSRHRSSLFLPQREKMETVQKAMRMRSKVSKYHSASCLHGMGEEVPTSRYVCRVFRVCDRQKKPWGGTIWKRSYPTKKSNLGLPALVLPRSFRPFLKKRNGKLTPSQITPLPPLWWYTQL